MAHADPDSSVAD